MFDKNERPSQLSNLDYPQVLKTAYNQEDKALDILLSNDFTPRRYVKVEYDYKDMGDDTFEVEYIKFYGEGTPHTTYINCRGNPDGRAEITTISFANIRPEVLNGKFFKIYDSVGSVGVWFNLNGTSVMPITGALRDIEVNIGTSDTQNKLASKLRDALNLDAEFSCMSSGFLVIIASASIGDKPDATSETSQLLMSIQKGLSSISGKYFFIYSMNDETKYYVWYNLNGLSIDPAPIGAVGIEIPVISSDDENQIAIKTSEIINDTDDFNSKVSTNEVIIENARYGIASNSEDVNSEHGFLKTQIEGEIGGLVSKVRIFYDDITKLMTSIEKIV